MINKKLLMILAVFLIQPLLAHAKVSERCSSNDETLLIIPNKTELVSLSRLENRQYVNIPVKLKKQSMPLTPGKYQFELETPASYSKFISRFEIEAGMKYFYIHQTLSPDRKYVWIWASPHSKESPQFDLEALEYRCRSFFDPSMSDINTAETLAACEEWAKKGAPAANGVLGSIYEEGRAGTTDITKAIAYYKKGFIAGDDFASTKLSNMYFKNEDTQNNLNVLKVLAEKNNPYGLTFLAWAYMDGNGINKNPNIAHELALKAAKQGYPLSFRVLALLPTSQNKIKPDIIEALAWSNLYLRAVKSADYSFTSYYETILGEASPEQVAKAESRVQQLLETQLSSGLEGRFCIAKGSSLAPAKGKKIQYKVNDLDELFDVHSEQPTPILYLAANNLELEIVLHANEEYEAGKTITLDPKFLEDKCLYYDKKLELYDLGKDDPKNGCGCFTH